MPVIHVVDQRKNQRRLVSLVFPIRTSDKADQMGFFSNHGWETRKTMFGGKGAVEPKVNQDRIFITPKLNGAADEVSEVGFECLRWRCPFGCGCCCCCSRLSAAPLSPPRASMPTAVTGSDEAPRR